MASESTWNSEGLKLLSLDAGGFPHGYSQLECLDVIVYQYQQKRGLPTKPRPCELFHMIGGAGVGGLNALLLARLKLSIDEAKRAYIRMGNTVFGKRVESSSKYDHLLLEQVIKDIVKDYIGDMEAQTRMIDRTNKGDFSCKCFVNATPAHNIEHAHAFHSFESSKYPANDCFIWEAARATTADPDIFPSITIADPYGFEESFVAGRYQNSNPALDTLTEAERFFGKARKVSLFLSLGTGHQGIRSAPTVSDSNEQTSSRHSERLNRSSDVEKAVAKRLRIPGLYYRLEVSHGFEDIQVDEWKKIHTIVANTKSYLRDEDTLAKLEGVVASLERANGFVTLNEIEEVKSSSNFLLEPIRATQPLRVSDTDDIKKASDITILQAQQSANASGARHDSCLPGTRKPILEAIENWSSNATNRERIFWIRDVSGSGKSTVAKTMALNWRKQRRIVLTFFFQRGIADTSNTDLFCSTIAKDLASQCPKVHHIIAKAFKDDLLLSTRDFSTQFETLIVNPLQSLNSEIYLVIDAVDECDPRHRKQLLEELVNYASSLNLLKVLITSRPDDDIRETLGPAALVWAMEFEMQGSKKASNVEDITAYIDAHLGRFLSPQQRQQLVQHANGLFIWAATAQRMLRIAPSLGSREQLLDELLRSDRGSDINSLYASILKPMLEDKKYGRFYSHVLALMTILRESVSVSTLEKLVKEREEDVEQLLSTLTTVFLVGKREELIEFLHPTFREYLISIQIDKYIIDAPTAHSELAVRVLRTLISDLKYDICSIDKLNETSPNNADIADLPQRLRDVYKHSPALYYSAKFWTYHVAEGTQNQIVIQVLEEFLLSKLLNWLELLSLDGRIYSCIQNLEELQEHFSNINSFIVRTLCTDALRFTQTRQQWIENNALEAYKSALLFAPTETLLFQTYRTTQESQLPKILNGAEKGWSSHKILIGHTGAISCLAYSPNASRIVSGSNDKTLRIWDVTTSAKVGSFLMEHTGIVNCLAYSPDGTKIASGSDDKTVRVWNATTGASVGKPFEGHIGAVRCLAYSPDGTRIVSGSTDMTLRIWNPRNGQNIGNMLEGHTGTIRNLAYSPDGSRIISGSDDKTLRIWDAMSGVSVGSALEGHTQRISCLAYSLDGTKIASGSEDKTIRIWDATTGASIGNVLEGHAGPISCLAYSPDGARIVSGSSDKALRMWEATTGAGVGSVLKGHTGTVRCVAYSPDGTRIASGSNDRTLRIWDAMTGASVDMVLEGHTGKILCLAYSPDGATIVSGSEDNTLRIRDATIDASIGSVSKGHTKSIRCITYSPDQTRVVSGSSDKTLRIWDATTGASVGGVLEGHTGPITCLAYSPDGTRIVSGSNDHTLRIWDGTTGASVGSALKGHTFRISYLCYSPDGTRIVSGADDKIMRIWDATTGASVGNVLEGHTGSISCLAFSPDGTKFVSGSSDKTLRIWDAATGASIGSVLKGHARSLRCVAYSPDGTRIASGSDDKIIRIWDVVSGACAGSITSQTSPKSVEFRGDGKLICVDGQIWSISTLEKATNDTLKQPNFDIRTRCISVTGSPKHVFKVPEEYPVYTYAVSQAGITLGLSDGRVIIFDFSHMFHV